MRVPILSPQEQPVSSSSPIANKINSGAKVEILAIPGRGLEVTVDGEVQETIREAHLVMTTRPNGGQVRLRFLETVGDVEYWQDMIVLSSVIFATVKNESLTDSEKDRLVKDFTHHAS